MIPKICQNCAKQYLCKQQKEDCKEFISWIETKNYGEVKKEEKCIELE